MLTFICYTQGCSKRGKRIDLEDTLNPRCSGCRELLAGPVAPEGMQPVDVKSSDGTTLLRRSVASEADHIAEADRKQAARERSEERKQAELAERRS